jgi:MFS family permease
VAYIARPIGSIIWGHIADKYGRKKVMIGTVSLMAVPAIGMALMPSYESIGVTATILVVFLRFLQGIAFGGESPTVVVSLYEMAPKNRKGLYGSFYNPGALIGYFVGIVLMIVLTVFLGESNMQSFGWRFLFGLSLVFIALLSYMRLKLIETSTVKTSGYPILKTLKQDLPAILKILLYSFCYGVLFYSLLFHNYLIIWASDFGVSALIFQAIVVAFFMLMVIFMGFLSDKMNKLTLLKATYLLLIPAAPLLYALFLTKNLLYMLFGYFVFSVFTAIIASTFPALAIPQVSKNCRVSSFGIALGFSVIFGSFVPAINEILKAASGVDFSPSFLISFSAFVSLLTIYTLKNKKTIQ